MVTAALEGMANTVLLIGEWLLKQQQQLACQQRLLEEKQRQIEEHQKQIEELTDAVDSRRLVTASLLLGEVMFLPKL
jgi:phage-related minor tail protein